MKFHEKLTTHRKKNAMSQEDLADQLGVSRQAVSRWELGSTMPDAVNLLQLSDLFEVSVDYLLHDDYESDSDIPIVKEVVNQASEREKEYGKHSLFSIICWFTAFFCYMIASAINGSAALAALAVIHFFLAAHNLQLYMDHKHKQNENSTNKS